MNQTYHRLRPLPKMETEIELINAMVNVLTYEHLTAPIPNKVVIENANAVLTAKVNDIYKVLNNPQYPTNFKDVVLNDEDLLLK